MSGAPYIDTQKPIATDMSSPGRWVSPDRRARFVVEGRLTFGTAIALALLLAGPPAHGALRPGQAPLIGAAVPKVSGPSVVWPGQRVTYTGSGLQPIAPVKLLLYALRTRQMAGPTRRALISSADGTARVTFTWPQIPRTCDVCATASSTFTVGLCTSRRTGPQRRRTCGFKRVRVEGPTQRKSARVQPQ